MKSEKVGWRKPEGEGERGGRTRGGSRWKKERYTEGREMTGERC